MRVRYPWNAFPSCNQSPAGPEVLPDFVARLSVAALARAARAADQPKPDFGGAKNVCE